MPWKGQRIHLPDVEADPADENSAVSEGNTWDEDGAVAPESVPIQAGEDTSPGEDEGRVEISTLPAIYRQPSSARLYYRWPWFSILALLLGLLAQSRFDDPSNRSSVLGIALYGLAAAALLGAIFQKGMANPGAARGCGRTDANQLSGVGINGWRAGCRSRIFSIFK